MAHWYYPSVVTTQVDGASAIGEHPRHTLRSKTESCPSPTDSWHTVALESPTQGVREAQESPPSRAALTHAAVTAGAALEYLRHRRRYWVLRRPRPVRCCQVKGQGQPLTHLPGLPAGGCPESRGSDCATKR